MAGVNHQFRIGVFGGTFDPPHLGHLILAAECLYQLNLHKVLWVLTPFPPHKTERCISPVTERLLFLEAAVEGIPGFEVCKVDIDRPPPHYAVDTVNILKARYPMSLMVYLMGMDSLRDLPTWHEPGLFIQSVDQIGVVTRSNVKVSQNLMAEMCPEIAQKVSYVQMPEIEISSSDIRERITEAKPYRFFLPEKVYRVIEEGKYYQSLP